MKRLSPILHRIYNQGMPYSSGRREDLQGLRIVLYILLVSGVFCGSQVLLTLLPDNPIKLREKVKLEIQTVMPQGWAFFTKNPREPIIVAYGLQGNHWQQINGSGGSIKYLLGLNRAGRAVSVEISTIIAQIPESSWISSRLSLPEFIDSLHIQGIQKLSIKAKNSKNGGKCSGQIIIQRTTIPPWAWSTLRKEVIMPSEFAIVYVSAK
jgi:antimicrobial peptide system SdpA family protein